MVPIHSHHPKKHGDETHNLGNLASVQRIRKALRRKILKLLIQSRRIENPNSAVATTDICRTLINAARNIDEYLFHRAVTWDEYQDVSTLAESCNFVGVPKCEHPKPVWEGRYTDKDQILRKQITSIIHRMYVQRLPPNTSKAYKKTHASLIAQAIEKTFYQEARSRQEYADISTLWSRLDDLALEVKLMNHV